VNHVVSGQLIDSAISKFVMAAIPQNAKLDKRNGTSSTVRCNPDSYRNLYIAFTPKNLQTQTESLVKAL
jgi:hypothetical protein